MNTTRVIALLRELAPLLRELADAIDEGAPAPPTSAKSRKRVKVHPGPLHPDREPSPLDMERARTTLRRRGIHT